MAGDEKEKNNKDLIKYFERLRPDLEEHKINHMPYVILKQIALRYQEGTLWFRTGWKEVANNLGVTDNLIITEIESAANQIPEMPLILLMNRKMCGRSINVIIDCMIRMEEFDILKDLQQYVSKILPQDRQKDVSCSTSFITQQHSLNGHKNALQTSDSSKFSLESLGEKTNASPPVEEKLTVLIQHAESEINIVQNLSTEFANQDVTVKTLAEVLLQCEPDIVLETEVKEVDFVIPVLSEKFMEEIHSRNHKDSIYAQSNRRLHDLLVNEYNSSKPFNFKVRSVIVKGMNRKFVVECDCHELIKLQFRYPEEIPKLIDVLKRTKKSRAQSRNIDA